MHQGYADLMPSFASEKPMPNGTNKMTRRHIQLSRVACHILCLALWIIGMHVAIPGFERPCEARWWSSNIEEMCRIVNKVTWLYTCWYLWQQYWGCEESTSLWDFRFQWTTNRVMKLTNQWAWVNQTFAVGSGTNSASNFNIANFVAFSSQRNHSASDCLGATTNSPARVR